MSGESLLSFVGIVYTLHVYSEESEFIKLIILEPTVPMYKVYSCFEDLSSLGYFGPF